MKSALFKNITPFTYETPVASDYPEFLETMLSAKPFAARMPTQRVSAGWIKPLGGATSTFTHTIAHCTLITLQVETAILPAPVVARRLAEVVAEIEKSQDRKVSNQEKKTLREDVELELLPRAFSKIDKINAYVDSKHGWLCIDTASPAVADLFATTLRKTLGTLPIAVFETENALSVVLTNWVQEGHASDLVELGHAVSMKDSASAKVKYSNQHLVTKEIEENIQSGKAVIELELDFDERINFTLTDTFQLKSLKFGSEFDQTIENLDPQTHAEALDVEFSILTGEVALLIKHLLNKI